MYPTITTKLQWLKMIQVKNCSRIINDNICPCATNLRKLYLKKPQIHQPSLRAERQIEVALKKYEKCFTP